MRKMRTLFEQNSKYEVIPVLRVQNEFILSGDYTVYRKRDGTSTMIKDNELYKRYDANVKKGRKVPDGAIPCQDEPGPTGSFPVWVKVESNDKYHLEAFAKQDVWEDGTYELCGEKINGNKENLVGHILIPHNSEVIEDVELDFNSIRDYLTENVMEGFVIKDNKTGLMTKIRRKDFGLDW